MIPFLAAVFATAEAAPPPIGCPEPSRMMPIPAEGPMAMGCHVQVGWTWQANGPVWVFEGSALAQTGTYCEGTRCGTWSSWTPAGDLLSVDPIDARLPSGFASAGRPAAEVSCPEGARVMGLPSQGTIAVACHEERGGRWVPHGRSWEWRDGDLIATQRFCDGTPCGAEFAASQAPAAASSPATTATPVPAPVVGRSRPASVSFACPEGHELQGHDRDQGGALVSYLECTYSELRDAFRCPIYDANLVPHGAEWVARPRYVGCTAKRGPSWIPDGPWWEFTRGVLAARGEKRDGMPSGTWERWAADGTLIVWERRDPRPGAKPVDLLAAERDGTSPAPVRPAIISGPPRPTSAPPAPASASPAPAVGPAVSESRTFGDWEFQALADGSAVLASTNVVLSGRGGYALGVACDLRVGVLTTTIMNVALAWMASEGGESIDDYMMEVSYDGGRTWSISRSTLPSTAAGRLRSASSLPVRWHLVDGLVVETFSLAGSGDAISLVMSACTGEQP